MSDEDRPESDQSNDGPTIPPNAKHEDSTIADPDSRSLSDSNVEIQARRFGDYELLEEIARGGMGVVFKARQINLSRIVALKMILAGQFASEEDVLRFYTEAEAAAQLDHPGIVPIFEIGDHEQQHYFSMGYIDGESLAHKIADGPLPPRNAAEIVQKISEAISYAHAHRVIHRDLKPANILIDEDGQPKVTDFGLAKKTEADNSLTNTGQIIGTPAYMPPEQASGETDIGPLADIYSLGAILYCLLTGRPPFQAATPMDTLLQVLEKDPAPPRLLNPNVDRDLETICLKCLEKSRDARYQSASAIADDLGRFLRDEPIKARSVNILERLTRIIERSQIDSGFESWGAVMLAFAPIVLVAQLALFAVIATRQPIGLVFATQGTQFALMGIALWKYGPSDLRPATAAQRQIWAIWVGFLLASGLVAIISQIMLGADRMYDFFLYPYWSTLSGLAFFCSGAGYWGWFYLFGIAFFLAAIVCSLFPQVGPLLFGLLWSVSLVATGHRLRRNSQLS